MTEIINKSLGENSIKIGMASFVPRAFETALRITPPQEMKNYSGMAILTALRSVFKDETKRALLLRQPDRLNFFFKSTRLAVAQNDYEDIVPYAKQTANTELERIVTKNVIDAKDDLTKSMEHMAIPEQQNLKNFTETYLDEIQSLEHTARNLPNEPQAIVEYRELMNAINVVHFARALLGTTIDPELMQNNRIPTIPKKEVTIPSLRQKYKWVLENSPQNSTERKIGALFNLVMGMQVIDDTIDKSSDEEIHAPNIARSITNETKLKDLRNKYFEKATELGVTKTSTLAIKESYTAFKKMLSRRSNGSRITEHTFFKQLKAT